MVAKEVLEAPVDVYNLAFEKLYRSEYGDSDKLCIPRCVDCHRFYDMFCICDKAQERFQKTLEEVRQVTQENNKPISLREEAEDFVSANLGHNYWLNRQSMIQAIVDFVTQREKVKDGGNS